MFANAEPRLKATLRGLYEGRLSQLAGQATSATAKLETVLELVRAQQAEDSKDKHGSWAGPAGITLYAMRRWKDAIPELKASLKKRLKHAPWESSTGFLHQAIGQCYMQLRDWENCKMKELNTLSVLPAVLLQR